MDALLAFFAMLFLASVFIFIIYLLRDSEAVSRWLHSNKIDATTKEIRRERAIKDRKVKLTRRVEDSEAELEAIKEKEEAEGKG